MAVKSFLTNLQLNGNQLLKSVFENVAIDPSQDLIAGRIIYNTTSNTLKFYNGTAWTELGDSSAIAKAIVNNTDGSISIAEPTVADGTIISVALSEDSDQDITLESDGLKVAKYSGSNSIDIGNDKSISVSAQYTNSIIGTSQDTKDSDTIEGAKRYADNVETTLKGSASTDSKESETIAGAKKYADWTAQNVVGTPSDTAADNTVMGAKAYTDSAKSDLIGQSGDLASAQTICGAKKYTDDAIDALDDAKVEVSGQYIKSAQQTNGHMTYEFKQIEADEVAVADANEYFTATDVEGVLAELYEQAGTGSQIYVQEITSGLGDNVLKAYKIYQGGQTDQYLKGTINIPKDLVVTSGSVVRGTWNGDVFTEDPTGADKALKLTIANQTDPVYINVVDLVKDHTAGDGIDISSTNEISVVIDPTSESFLSLSSSGVKLDGVQSAITSAKSEVIGTTQDTASDDTIKGTKQLVADTEAALIGSSNDAASAQTICGAKNYSDSNKADVIGTAQDTASDDTIYGAKAYADNAVQTLDQSLPHYYTETITPASGVQSATIAAATHGCGPQPMVQVYQGTELVIAQVSIAVGGAITISWNGSPASLTIVVIGKPAQA